MNNPRHLYVPAAGNRGAKTYVRVWFDDAGEIRALDLYRRGRSLSGRGRWASAYIRGYNKETPLLHRTRAALAQLDAKKLDEPATA